MTTTRNNNIIVVISCFLAVLQLCHSSPVFVPQFLSGGSGRNIRHLPCVSRRTGEQGVCMFAFTCAKANGTHLGTCIDRFYFGSCCKIDDPSTAIDVFPQDNTIDTDNTSPAKPFLIASTTIATTSRTTTSTTSTSTTNQPLESNDIPGNVDNKSKTRPTKRPQAPVDATTQSTRLSTFQTVQNNASQQRHTTLPTTSSVNTKIAATPRPTSTTAFYLTTSSSAAAPSRKPTPPATTFGQRISTKKPATSGSSSTAFSKKPVPTTGPTSSSSFSSSSSSSSSVTASSTKLHRNVTSTVADKPTLITTTTQRTYPATRFPPRNATTISSTKISSYATTTTKSTILAETTFKPTATKKPVKTTSKRPTTTTTTVTKKPTATTLASKKPVTTASTSVVTKAATTTISPLTSVKLTTPTTITSTKKIATKKPSTTLSSTLGLTKKPVTNATHVTKKPVTSTTIVTKKPATTTSTTLVTKKPATTTTSVPTTTPAPRTTTTLRPITTIASTTRRPTTATTLKRTTTTPSPATRLTTTSAPTSASQASTLKFTTTPPTTTKSKPTNLPVATTAKPTVAVTKPTAKITTSTTSAPAPTTTTTTTTVKPLPPTKNATISNEIDAEFDEQTPAGLVTWSSFPDESPTKAPAKEPDTTETEWQPITTPDGWIIIQSPTTEQEESEVEVVEEAKPVTSSSSTTSSISSSSSSSTATPTTTTRTTTTTSKPSTTTTTTMKTTPTPTTESTTTTTTTTTQRVITTEPTTYVDMLSTLASVTLAPDLTELPAAPVNMSNYKDVCGRRLFPEPKIVGGDSSTFGKWPWQISLRQWRTSTYLHKCGAALLNENWAITAAHCVQNVLPSDLLLRIGEHDLGNEDEPYGFQERRVQIVASHPNFDPRTFEFDLALMRFYEPVLPFQPNVLPICIPDDDEDYVGQTAFVTGWGRLYEDGPLPSVLQEVAVPVINNSVCEGMYRNAGYIEHIPHIFICAGWRKGGFDSCEGDSGGPLVIQRKRDKRWVLAGVISWGIGCAEPNQPGVYTRISEFREWINQILQF